MTTLIDRNIQIRNLNLKATVKTSRIFFSLGLTTKIKGITSKLANGKHLLFFDFDNIPLEYVKEELKKIQQKNRLSNIYIFSDKKESYRAICFNQVSFYQFFKITTQLPENMVDLNYMKMTMYRGYATLRLTQKKDRPQQKPIATLKTYYIEPPIKQMLYVYYNIPKEEQH